MMKILARLRSVARLVQKLLQHKCDSPHLRRLLWQERAEITLENQHSISASSDHLHDKKGFMAQARLWLKTLRQAVKA